MSSRRAILHVAGREISTRVRSKAYLWTTGILLAAIVAGGVLLTTLGGQALAPQPVGVTQETARLAPALIGAGASTGIQVEVSVVEEAAGESQLLEGELRALLTGPAEDPTVVVKDELNPQLQLTLGVLWQQLSLDREISALGGDPAKVAQSVATATPTVRALEGTGPVNEGRAFVGLLGGVLIFIAITSTGQLVAQGVVEEKTSRVVELLLSTIRPWELLAGKVLGIGAIGMLQLVLIAAAAAGTAAATGALEGTGIDLSATLVWVLIWFVLGYAMFALVLASAAALVSRQEDVGSVVAPVIVVMMIPYMVGVTVGTQDPGSPLIANMSLFPLFSPFLMPIRIASGVIEGWELALAVALSAAVIPLLVWLSGRIYRNAVLRTGARVSLRSALGR
jgi:ABC-2 type transport system permease protein